eukprot:CAMPEP_0177637724 /NCGR_PEP_ID=MMETSP0447-20121125/5119_1 /TAXON_ID=0 /ORGANISM="Stygamoeba regulata, Strain BSH-02190019" /LENGTH=213 /DNA_ID=CAMNT_0019139661 /DNA_START=255 /DNA_END=896 /DNA_ORIENTATION=-
MKGVDRSTSSSEGTRKADAIDASLLPCCPFCKVTYSVFEGSRTGHCEVVALCLSSEADCVDVVDQEKEDRESLRSDLMAIDHAALGTEVARLRSVCWDALQRIRRGRHTFGSVHRFASPFDEYSYGEYMECEDVLSAIATDLTALSPMDPGEILSVLARLDDRMRTLSLPETRVLFSQGSVQVQQEKHHDRSSSSDDEDDRYDAYDDAYDHLY